MFKRIFKAYFTFSRGERTGIFILSVLLIVLILVHLLAGMFHEKQQTDFTLVEKAVLEWEKSFTDKAEIRYAIFPFDPNSVGPEKLDSMGIPPYVKRNILKYKESGGRFRSPDDLRKIYGMTDSLFNLIRDHIVISGNNRPVAIYDTPEAVDQDHDRSAAAGFKSDVTNDAEQVEEDMILIDLNQADSARLITVKGIGPVYAARILKYRELLGGYHSPAQLREIYGLSPETYASISRFFVADTLRLKRIRLNFTEFRELVRHPYLKREQVISILRHRDKMGPFSHPADLIEYDLIDTVTFLKISPYITCN